MQLYKLTIRSVSSFCSRLQSDTFFGVFCWSYKYIYGEPALEAMLENAVQNKPAVIFSNAFPEGALPLPLGIVNLKQDFIGEASKAKGKAAYQLNKKFKKAEYIKVESFQKMVQEQFSCHPEENYIAENVIIEQDTVRNMVNRSTGSVENMDGAGNLYAQTEYYCKTGRNLDVYIRSTMEEEKLLKVLELMFLLGIGANKSVGKGRFEIESFQKAEELGTKTGANAYVILSNYIPRKEDATNGYYSTFVKNPMVDREYATKGVPYKKPLLIVNSGSVFFSGDKEVQEYYGRCVSHVSSLSDKIVVSGYSLAVPIQITGGKS